MMNAFSRQSKTCQADLKEMLIRILVGSIIVFPLIYAGVPALRKVIVRENNVLELLTAFFYTGACLYGWWLCVEARRKGVLRQYWLIPLLGFLGLLEEESFGHSFLYFEVPKIWDIQVDALHDLVRVGIAWVLTWDESTQVLFSVGCVGGLLYFLWKIYSSWSRVERFFCEHPPFVYVGVCGMFLFVALFLDLEWINDLPGLMLIEELFEMFASVSLLWSCFSLNCFLGD